MLPDHIGRVSRQHGVYVAGMRPMVMQEDAHANFRLSPGGDVVKRGWRAGPDRPVGAVMAMLSLSVRSSCSGDEQRLQDFDGSIGEEEYG